MNRVLHKAGFALVLTLIVLAAGGCAALITPNFSTELSELRAGEYQLDPEHAYVHFRIQHLGLSTIVGNFNTVQGSLDFDPTQIENLALQGKLLAASIDLNNEDLQQRLLGAQWLNAAEFPEIEFKSGLVSQSNTGDIEIAGTLSMRGQTRPVILAAKFNGGADNILTGKYTLGFSASTVVNRSEFGMDAFAALIGDEIKIELHGEFQRN